MGTFLLRRLQLNEFLLRKGVKNLKTQCYAPESSENVAHKNHEAEKWQTACILLHDFYARREGLAFHVICMFSEEKKNRLLASVVSAALCAFVCLGLSLRCCPV